MIRATLLRHGLMAVVFVSFAVSLWSANMNLRGADGAIRSRLAENAVWAGAQVQTELSRFRDAVHMLAADPTPQAVASLRRRFDILWSRVGVLESGDLARLLAEAGVSPLVVELRNEMVRIDPFVASLGSGTADGARRLQVESDGLWPKTQTLAAAIMQAEQDRVVGLIDQRDEAIQSISFALLGLLISGCVTLISLSLALRREKAARNAADFARHAAVDAKMRLQAALESMSDGFAMVDADGTFRLTNSQFADLFSRIPAGVDPGDSYKEFADTLAEMSADRHIGSPVPTTGLSAVTLRLVDDRHIDVRVRPVDGGGLVCVASDATNREQWLEQTEAARLAAERSNAAKSKFLAMMSHEIRTPLNGVLGMLEALADEPMNEDTRRYIDVAIRSAGSLRTVIDDLLDASKMEAGKLHLNPRAIAPGRLVTEVCDLLRAPAQAGRTALTDRVAPDVPSSITGDPDRIRQILMNLVGNAIKFSPSGHVDVTLDVEHCDDGSEFLAFSVRDTGIGIPEDHEGSLFQPFEQVDAGYARNFGGTGLGLSIAKALVEAMGGSIGFTSRPGQGSTFWFRIPLTPAENLHDTADDVTETDLTPSARPRVLLVEDSETNRLVVRTFLRSIDAVIDEADNGEAGVEMATRHRYDLVLMDVSMPVMDGVEATQRIRAFTDVPIIGLSAHAFEEEITRCRAAGMDDYLAKPVPKKALVDKVVAFANRTPPQRSRERLAC